MLVRVVCASLAVVAILSVGNTQVLASAIAADPDVIGDGSPAIEAKNGLLNSNSVLYAGPTADPTGKTSGIVTLDIDMYAKHRPLELVYSMFKTFDGITARTYTFNVTINNKVGQGTESPLQPAAAGDDIQNIEFTLKTAVAPQIAFTNTSGPAGPIFIYTNGAGNSVLRFGGANGGGPAISNGSSQLFSFNVATTASSTPFSLIVTANPEPTSLVLAGLGACLFGGGGYLRRRKRIQQNVTPSVDVLQV